MLKKIFTHLTLIFLSVVLISCSTNTSTSYFANGPQLSENKSSSLWQNDTNSLWLKLQLTSLQKLQTMPAAADPIQNGWVKLAIVSKQNNGNGSELAKALMAWRAEFPKHPGNALIPDNSILQTLANQPVPKHIALLLPLKGSAGTSGQAVREGVLSAYYNSHRSQTISFYDTSSGNVSALYNQAIAAGADTVIGPLTKDDVQTLLSQNSFSVTTIALNYVDPRFGSLPTNFYEFGLSPQDESMQAADKAHKMGYSRAILIAPAGDWGNRASKALSDRFKELGGTIVDTYYFPKNANFTTDIANLLHSNPKSTTAQRRQDFDSIFLLAPPSAARQIVPLIRYDFANNIPIFSTSMIYSGTPMPQNDADLNGVYFCDIPAVLNNTTIKTRFHAVGQDAYVLTNEINRMMLLPNFPIYGATGALFLTPQHQVHRRLPWTQMRNGYPNGAPQ